MRIRHLLAAAVAGACIAAVVAWAIPASASGPAAGNVAPMQTANFPHIDHVFVIMMENTAYNDLLDPSNANTPFIRNLASTYGLDTNYLAATSGSNWGSNSDDVAQAPLLDHTNVVDQFEQAGINWKAYMENIPGPGDTIAQTPDHLYVRKHDPFLMYPDVYNDPSRANKVVPLSQLTTDLSTNTVPSFVWISPNQCNDMHGGATGCPFANAPGDANQQHLYQAWTGHSAIFITWDEGSFADEAPFGPNDINGCCDSPIIPATPVNTVTGSGGDLAGGTTYGGGHVPMIVIQRNGVRGVTSDTATNHYSLLQTIEQNWNLPYLGNASDTVQVHSLRGLLANQ